MTGENLIPEQVIMLDDDLTSYTVPAGKYAKISNILRVGIHSAEQSYIHDTYHSIDLQLPGQNPETVIIGDSANSGYWSTTLTGPMYFPEGTIIFGADTSIRLLPIEIYSNSNFNAVVVTDSYTVPSGKKVKVSSIIPAQGVWDNGLILNGHSIIVEGKEVIIAGGDCNDCQPSNRRLANLIDKPFWLDESMTISPGNNVYGISILEFDSSQATSSTGGGSNDGSGGGSGCDYKTVSVVEAPENALHIDNNNTGMSNAALWGTQLAIDEYMDWNQTSAANINYENYPGGNYDGLNLVKEYTGINSNELLFQFINVFGEWGWNTLVGIRAYDSNNNLVPFYYEHEFFAYDLDQNDIVGNTLREGKLTGNSDGNFQWVSNKFHQFSSDRANVKLKIISGVEIERIEVEFNKEGSVGNAKFYGQLFIWKFDCADGSDNSSGSNGTNNPNSYGSCEMKTAERLLDWTTNTELDNWFSYTTTYNYYNPQGEWQYESSQITGFEISVDGGTGPDNCPWPCTNEDPVTFSSGNINAKELKIEFAMIAGGANYSIICLDSQGQPINVYAEQKHIGYNGTKFTNIFNSEEIKSNRNDTEHLSAPWNSQERTYSEISIKSNVVINNILLKIDGYDPAGGTQTRADFKAWKLTCSD